MEREALLLYLQNVRDLEVTRYWLRVNAIAEEKEFKRQSAELSKTNYLVAPEDPGSLGCLFWGSMIMAVIYLLSTVFVFFYAFGTDDQGWLTGLMLMVGILFGAIASVIFNVHTGKREDYKTEKERVSVHNTKELARVMQNKEALSEIKEEWGKRTAWYQQEFDRIGTLLKDFYNMNIVPAQFRNISAICYIYDYMSTSRESLTSALFDQHMEDGIRRIEEKLDKLISGLEKQIYETRCIRENTERTIAQNTQMLENLRSVEQNTLRAAQYAELGANYSKANAYYSRATYYLKLFHNR